MSVDSAPPAAGRIVLHFGSSQQLAPLLDRIAAGEQGAFADFYDATASIVFGMALAVSSDAARAEVFTQELYTRAWTNAPTFHSFNSTVDEWLTDLLRNILTESGCPKHLRR